jgi:hypothetical protein
LWYTDSYMNIKLLRKYPKTGTLLAVVALLLILVLRWDTYSTIVTSSITAIVSESENSLRGIQFTQSADTKKIDPIMRLLVSSDLRPDTTQNQSGLLVRFLDSVTVDDYTIVGVQYMKRNPDFRPGITDFALATDTVLRLALDNTAVYRGCFDSGQDTVKNTAQSLKTEIQTMKDFTKSFTEKDYPSRYIDVKDGVITSVSLQCLP